MGLRGFDTPLMRRIAGTTGPAGRDFTLHRLTANSADTTSTTPAAVMTTQGVGPGTYTFKYTVIYQTAATTTGVKFNVNHTGTVTQFASHWRQLDTSATASTGVGDDITGAAAGSCGSGWAEAVINTSTTASVGVTGINTDIMCFIEGLIVISATGNMELKFATEVGGSAARVMADSNLFLVRIG